MPWKKSWFILDEEIGSSSDVFLWNRDNVEFAVIILHVTHLVCCTRTLWVRVLDPLKTQCPYSTFTDSSQTSPATLHHKHYKWASSLWTTVVWFTKHPDKHRQQPTWLIQQYTSRLCDAHGGTLRWYTALVVVLYLILLNEPFKLGSLCRVLLCLSFFPHDNMARLTSLLSAMATNKSNNVRLENSGGKPNVVLNINNQALS